MTFGGFLSIGIFTLAYAFVMMEDKIHLRKSKPVLISAGLIWIIIAFQYWIEGNEIQDVELKKDFVLQVDHQIKDYFTEYSELFLFLISAMTAVNTAQDRGLFLAIKSWIVNKGFTYRQIFWITGLCAFFISPIADNLTTGLIMCAVVMTIADARKGGDQSKFVQICCVNIVVAANAGGAFSPFGDITSLMAWVKGVLTFTEFFNLFIPCVVAWIVPAGLMMFAVPKANPDPVLEETKLNKQALVVGAIFLLTISMAVTGHIVLHIPPAMMMMFGLGILMVYTYFIRRIEKKDPRFEDAYSIDDLLVPEDSSESYTQEAPTPINIRRGKKKDFGLTQEFKHDAEEASFSITSWIQENKDQIEGLLRQNTKPKHKPFDIFISIKRAEWDTLLFFYGVIMSVGGLSMIGYLRLLATFAYTPGANPDLTFTLANSSVGVISAIVDNIPTMFAVLDMKPDMGTNQWLLVTLTAGIGGSLLSIGSAAGVALMGQAKDIYTFKSHLKYTPHIALGYIASIGTHLLINGF